MASYLFSLLVGLVVGAAYGLIHVRSPAPPAIALLGLLGMLAGEYGVGLAVSGGKGRPSPTGSTVTESRFMDGRAHRPEAR